ncbi:MAG: ABC-2 family transporter protein [Acutalibacteraceae bacterium]|nr:ABC-2 family transporter protein [Acutalibacteraceae bacterium]
MRKFLKVYTPFTKAGILQTMAYRFNFLFFLIGEMFKCFIMYYVWRAVFESSNSSTFMGFSMIDMTVYLFISFLTGYLTYSDGAYAVGEEIRDGSIAMRMIKPVSFDMTFLFQEIGNRCIIVLVVLVPICVGVEIYKFMVTGTVMFNPINFGLFMVSTLIAYLISFYFNVCYGFMAFFLKNLWGSNILKEVIVDFLSGATIPLAFMPEALKNVLTFLPFSSLNYTPVMIYMGMYSLQKSLALIVLQLFWLGCFVLLSKFIWHSAIKRLAVQGG